MSEKLNAGKLREKLLTTLRKNSPQYEYETAVIPGLPGLYFAAWNTVSSDVMHAILRVRKNRVFGELVVYTDRGETPADDQIKGRIKLITDSSPENALRALFDAANVLTGERTGSDSA